jgi:hypothetical protein
VQHSLFSVTTEAVINQAIERTHICKATVTLVHHHFRAAIKQAIERIHICKASVTLVPHQMHGPSGKGMSAMNLIRTIDLDSNISVDIVTVKSIKNHI